MLSHITGRYAPPATHIAHDGRDLRDAHRGHDCVIAKHASEIVGVGEDIFLQRQEHAGRIDQINRRNVILDRNVLRADDLLRRHGKERPGFDRGVIHDQHEQSSVYASQSRDHTRRRRAAPLFVHLVCGIEPQFEELGVTVDQQRDALARGQPLFACCDSMAFSPPPWRMISSSLRTAVTISAMARMFFSKRRGGGVDLRGELGYQIGHRS